MSKFGDLIDVDVPVLFDFFREQDDASNSMQFILKDVLAVVGDKVRIIKIDVDKNTALSEALRVKTLPTLIIYKSGDMKWRQSGELDANTIIGLLQDYI
tara:strand:- start:229 stop:525 length:297 start_codon:yes stop_codon:yes gene_type:complete